MNRRSDTLKTFAGDTAFPGGKIDAEDVTVEDTAVSHTRAFSSDVVLSFDVVIRVCTG